MREREFERETATRESERERKKDSKKAAKKKNDAKKKKKPYLQIILPPPPPHFLARALSRVVAGPFCKSKKRKGNDALDESERGFFAVFLSGFFLFLFVRRFSPSTLLSSSPSILAGIIDFICFRLLTQNWTRRLRFQCARWRVGGKKGLSQGLPRHTAPGCKKKKEGADSRKMENFDLARVNFLSRLSLFSLGCLSSLSLSLSHSLSLSRAGCHRNWRVLSWVGVVSKHGVCVGGGELS